MKKFYGFLRIIRPFNVIITFFSIVVACIICSDENLNTAIIMLAGLSGAITSAAGNIINDIFDIEIDKINRPERVLASGTLKKTEANFLYVILNFMAIAITFFINIQSSIIVILSVILIFFYSYYFKKIPLLGNFIVALMTALAFLFGGVAVGNLNSAVIPGIFAFLINFIREIIKDIEDLEGDIKNKIYSFPARYGINPALRITFILTIILFLFTFIPFVFKIYRIEYFIIVMLTVNTGLFLFLIKMKGEITKIKISKQSFLLKVYMIFGLLAIYFGN